MSDGGRQVIVDALRRELIGPDPKGSELDLSQRISFADRTAALGPWVEKGTGQEIITDRVKPMRRYATGVLFPASSKALETNEALELELLRIDEGEDDADQDSSTALGRSFTEGVDDDFDLSPVNERDPESAALTFVIRESTFGIRLALCGGRYESFDVSIGSSKKADAAALASVEQETKIIEIEESRIIIIWFRSNG